MNKALEDLQAGRDPFATREPEPNGELYPRLALWSLCLSIVAGVLWFGGSALIKNQTLDPKVTALAGLALLLVPGFLIAVSALLGIVALCGMREQGTAGILGRSVAGMGISGIVTAFVLVSFAGMVSQRMERQKALNSVQASVDKMRTEISGDLGKTNVVGFTNYQRQAQNVKNALEDASQKLSGPDALVAKAASATMGKMQAAMNDYTVAATPLMQPTFLTMSGVEQPSQLQAKKEVVSKFMAANERFLAFVNGMEKTFTADMNSFKVPAEAQAEALQGFNRSVSAQKGLLPKIREKDRIMGTAMMGMFNLLEANWGHWTYNAETKKVKFEDSAVLEKYNAFLRTLVTAGREQTDLQKQYFAMQTRGG